MTAVLEGGEWSAARPGRTLFRERPGTHFTGGWVGPRAGLDGAEKLVPTGIQSRTVQPVAQSLYLLSNPTCYLIINYKRHGMSNLKIYKANQSCRQIQGFYFAFYQGSKPKRNAECLSVRLRLHPRLSIRLTNVDHIYSWFGV